MRYLIIGLSLLVCVASSAQAQIGVAIGLPGVSIGINVPVYPQLVRVPGYPVYYDPGADRNYFFYDGMYWVYQGDNWYASSWYNGPWDMVGPEEVPLFVLRVPVRYYRQPPMYFRGWRDDQPPRWGEHWGRDWEDHRRGWDRWDRHSAPRPAPLPMYQRRYSGDRYPRDVERQHSIQSQRYRYQPRETVTRQHFQRQDRPQQQQQDQQRQQQDRQQQQGQQRQQQQDRLQRQGQQQRQQQQERLQQQGQQQRQQQQERQQQQDRLQQQGQQRQQQQQRLQQQGQQQRQQQQERLQQQGQQRQQQQQRLQQQGQGQQPRQQQPPMQRQQTAPHDAGPQNRAPAHDQGRDNKNQ